MRVVGTAGHVDHGKSTLVAALTGTNPDRLKEEQARQMVEKITNLRIFEDDHGKMNRSILEAHGEAIVVSQFTLYANTRGGRRPSFIEAALPDLARPLVDSFARLMAQAGVPTKTGEFAARMMVELVNDGPVTIWLEISPDNQ